MNTLEIKRTQQIIGAEPDGFWGPKSTAACKRYLLGLMPSNNPWPSPDDASVTDFFGPHGQPDGYTPPLADIEPPFQMFYDRKPVKRIRCHEKCAASLSRVLAALKNLYPMASERERTGISIYDGCYNPRPMRGGNRWSKHAWGIALDFDAGRNGNLTHWPTSANMPIEIMAAFAREGWTAAGAFWSRDAMHFEATHAT